MYILDDAEKPVATDDLAEYGYFLCCDTRRFIAVEEVNGCCVSTVFVGDRYPMLWETLCRDLDGLSKFQMRYESRAEAEAGHKLAVARAKARTELR